MAALEETLVEKLWPLIERKLEREMFSWRWATPEQLGELLGIGAQAVRVRCRNGTLPGKKLEGRWLIDLRALDTALRNGSYHR